MWRPRSHRSSPRWARRRGKPWAGRRGKAWGGGAGPGLALGGAVGSRQAERQAALDLASLRVVCDWIQYRHNFYEPVEVRPVLADRPRQTEPGGTGPQVSGRFQGGRFPGLAGSRPAQTGLEIAI